MAYKRRLDLQSSILFGSRIKGLSQGRFSEREGYNETFLDSLPIVRDIPDFTPHQWVITTFLTHKKDIDIPQIGIEIV